MKELKELGNNELFSKMKCISNEIIRTLIKHAGRYSYMCEEENMKEINKLEAELEQINTEVKRRMSYYERGEPRKLKIKCLCD